MTLPPFVPLRPEQVALIEANPVPVLVLDAHERIRYINPAGQAFAEDPSEDLIGVMVWDRYPSLVGSGFHREYRRVLRDRIALRFEEYRPEVDAWYSVLAYPMEDGLIATLHDITQEKRNAEAVRRSEQTLRLAQECAHIGTYLRDLRSQQSEWSDHLYRMLGYEPGELDATAVDHDPARSFIHPEDLPHVRATWKHALISGGTERVRHRIIRRDGQVRTFDANFFTVRDQHDEPARVVGTVRDVTEEVRAIEERAQLEAQMQQAQKLESLGVLAGGIAHDFNNLLVGILGNASLALLDLASDSPVRASVAEIEQAAQRAAELTRQLLAYAGKGRLVVEAIDASNVVREMTALLRTAVARNAQVRLQLADGLSSIEADITQLRQAIMNLVTNASDALPESGGLIHVHTGEQWLDEAYLAQCVPGTDAQPGHFVFIEVRDEGDGMDEATRARIFDPFFTTRFTGRGLGLAATLGIVRGHRGAIRVCSEPGHGTSMKLHFPARDAAPDGADPRPADEWRGAGTILIVDDEPTVRAVTQALLRRRGFLVEEASSGEDAIALVRAAPDRFRLVLLDLTMPGLTGEETFRELRALAPSLEIILMSGYNEQDVTRTFMGQGLAAFLPKPFRMEELDRTIRKVLG